MPLSRREFLLTTAAGTATLKQGMAALGAPVGSLRVAIDATKTGEPVSPLVFGGYMEPATTRVWAEMLNDRKFLKPITSVAPKSMNPFLERFFRMKPWKPVGADEFVEMDAKNPWVGKHSPRVKLDTATPHGIQQSGLTLRGGKSYVGRVYLKSEGSAKVEVRLVWGPGAGDCLIVPIPPLSSEYRKFPFGFTAPVNRKDAQFEIVGTGDGWFHIGAVSLMPADNVEGYDAGTIKLYREAGFAMAKWPGGNFVSTYDWRDGLGDIDKRPPRLLSPDFPIVESNDVGLHEYMAFCRLIGAEPDLTVNTGFGDARCAAEEVEYMNSSADTPMGKLRAENGHPEPFGVRLWCIGNEMYGAWQNGYMSLNQYWEKHNRFVEAMRKVDPTIKVTASGASICEMSWCAADQAQGEASMWKPPLTDKLPYEHGSKYDWDGWMLTHCADNMDFLSEHTYAFPNMVFDAQKQSFVDTDEPLQYKVRRDPNRIGYAFEAWQKYLQRIPSLKDKNIKFAFDE